MEISPITAGSHHIHRTVLGAYGCHLLANDQDKILVLHPIRDRWIMYV